MITMSEEKIRRGTDLLLDSMELIALHDWSHDECERFIRRLQAEWQDTEIIMPTQPGPMDVNDAPAYPWKEAPPSPLERDRF